MSFIFREEKGEELTYKEVDDNNRYALTIVTEALLAISRVAGFLEVINGTNGMVIGESEIGNCVVMDFAAENSLVLPEDSTRLIPVGSILSVRRMGPGLTTVVPANGVSLVSSTGTYSLNTYGSASLHKVAANTWVMEGNLL